MKQDPNPISPAPPMPASDPVHQNQDQHYRHPTGTKRGSQKLELKMTSMIDVVFLLLIFFIVTATFTVDEGSLLANLPGNTTDGDDPPPTPVQVDLSSSDDGVTYSLLVNGARVEGASELATYMSSRVQAGQMAADDFVQIKPQGAVRWQHVVNVYNACVNAELEQVTFAY